MLGLLSCRYVLSPVGDIAFVMLTWRSEDTSTTMTVLYQTEDNPGVSKIVYDTVSRKNDKQAYRQQTLGSRIHFKQRDRFIHTVELSGLKAATRYYFAVSDKHGTRGEEYSFRTLPDDGSPIRIVAGGDMDTTQVAAQLSRQAARLNPDLAIIGGDIAYAEGRMKKAAKWDRWMADWCRLMITTDGRIIPFIASIGNHEINHKKQGKSALKRAPFFLRYLNQDSDKRSYFTRKIGGNSALIVLDTSHLRVVEGEQTQWLSKQLLKYQNRLYRFAMYHKPMYPGGIYRDIIPGVNRDLADLWGPLFDDFKLTLALENHYHVHKRTKPLKHNAVSAEPGATVYLGGGAWGTTPRKVKPDLWYLASAYSKNHIWVIDVSEQKIDYRAVDAEGVVFDRGESFPSTLTSSILRSTQ